MFLHRNYPYLQAAIKCESISNSGDFQTLWNNGNNPVSTWEESEYLFYCTDRSGTTLSSVSGSYWNVTDWIENDILRQGACDEEYEPPTTSTTTSTSTTTESTPISCDYLKDRGKLVRARFFEMSLTLE